jgi:hypothetical protein
MLSIVMLSVKMPGVVSLTVIILIVIMLSAECHYSQKRMLSVNIPNVVFLIIIILSVFLLVLLFSVFLY